jgi:hypothetical protein
MKNGEANMSDQQAAKPGTEMFIEACQRVMRAARGKRPQAMIHYASEYAKLGIRQAIGSGGNPAMIRYTAVDILSNLDSWRGDEARKTKEMLRQFV